MNLLCFAVIRVKPLFIFPSRSSIRDKLPHMRGWFQSSAKRLIDDLPNLFSYVNSYFIEEHQRSYWKSEFNHRSVNIINRRSFIEEVYSLIHVGSENPRCVKSDSILYNNRGFSKALSEIKRCGNCFL